MNINRVFCVQLNILFISTTFFFLFSFFSSSLSSFLPFTNHITSHLFISGAQLRQKKTHYAKLIELTTNANASDFCLGVAGSNLGSEVTPTTLQFQFSSILSRKIPHQYLKSDQPRGLVVRASDYKPRGPGFDSRLYHGNFSL